MSERISVTITAQDGASKTFTAIGSSAQKMGDQIERAGTEGTQGLQKVDQAAAKTGNSFDGLIGKAEATGAALGVIVSATALLGQNSRSATQQVDAITRAYGDQADAILDLTEHVQDYSRFSNDSAREAALTFNTLTQNYGYSIEQLDALMLRSADVAQLRGRSLEEVSQMLQNAARGEAEYAEAIGVTLNDQFVAMEYASRGLGNWNALVDDAAKAQFRFQLIMEQTAYAQGAAGDAAESAGGQVRQFINTVDDGAEALGDFLGPIGEVAAEMAPILIALPVAGAGLGRLGAAFASTAAGARAAALGVGALRLALGPVGLIMAGLVAIGGSLFSSWMNQREAAQDYDASLQSLSDTLERLRRQGDTDLAATAENVQNLAESFREAFEATQPSKDDFKVGDFDNPLQAYSDAIMEFNHQYADIGENITAITNNITDALNDPLIDVDAYLGFVNRWLTAARMMPGTMDDIAITGMLANVELSHFSTATTDAAAATEDLAAATQTAGINMYGQIAAQIAANKQYAELVKNVEAFEDATQDWLSNGDNILDFWLQYQQNLREAQQARSDLIAQDMDPSVLGTAPTDFVSTTEAAFEATVRLADALSDAGAELDSVLATYQRIDALGQRSEQSGSIAENLVGTPGEWAAIDDLLASGAITLDQYNAALDAGYRIQESNVRVQEDLNTMRAAQLPLLAEEQRAYEAQIEAISQLPPLEQRRALALQDSAVQAQIAAQYATAYSASLGEIPPEVATNMIVSAAEADPVLKDLLLQFGLIEEGADGTITVNFPDGPTVQETITELTRSIDALIVAMGGVPPLHITADASQANSAIDDVQARMATLDATTANPNAVLVDSASGSIAAIRNALAALDGRTATTYVKTVYSTSGTGLRGDRPFAMGGVIPGYADGGVLFRGAEAGPEVLHFATGGVAPIFHDSLYRAPAGTYVSPANANPNLGSGGGISIGPIVFNGGGNRDEMNRWASDEFIPLIQDEMSRWQRSQGVV